MAHVITSACIDCVHKKCVEECPVDCIYEGIRALYIQPDECIDCGACVPACPEEAIFYEDDVPVDQEQHKQDNADFFYTILSGKEAELGSPGEAAPIAQSGGFGADTPLVSAFPKGHNICKLD